jgi:hypothetical protein
LKKFPAENPAARDYLIMPVCAGSYPKISELLHLSMKLSVVAGSSPKLSVCGNRRQFPSIFAIIVLQLVRCFSGGIRLLALQETRGQLLAKKEGSRASLIASIGGACA